jgi:hypothetical protein
MDETAAAVARPFLTLLRVFPEPRAVYGPEPARPARTGDVAAEPVTGPGRCQCRRLRCGHD